MTVKQLIVKLLEFELDLDVKYIAIPTRPSDDITEVTYQRSFYGEMSVMLWNSNNKEAIEEAEK